MGFFSHKNRFGNLSTYILMGAIGFLAVPVLTFLLHEFARLLLCPEQIGRAAANMMIAFTAGGFALFFTERFKILHEHSHQVKSIKTAAVVLLGVLLFLLFILYLGQVELMFQRIFFLNGPACSV